MSWAGPLWIAESPDPEPTPGMLFHRPDGISGCPVCGWSGVASSWGTHENPHLCPACQIAPQTDALYAAGGVTVSPQRWVTRREVPVQVGRNDPCICGSGRKFKKCCGA